MKGIISSLVCLIAFFSAGCQDSSGFDRDKYLGSKSAQPKVLLVGTWHFGYPGLDAHKTSEDEKVNVLLPHRQKEVQELVDYISKFKPTKVVVEADRNTGYLMHRRAQVNTGEEKRRPDEIDQVAFRLLDRFQLDTIYGADNMALSREWSMYSKDSTVMRPILDDIFEGYDYSSDDTWDAKYNAYYEANDRFTVQHTILETFKMMNHPQTVADYGGAYLTGDFKDREYKGTDAYLLYWYSRNLRIFRNIQNITENDDRIVVLFGAGHMTILHELFGNSPEYDLVPFGDID